MVFRLDVPNGREEFADVKMSSRLAFPQDLNLCMEKQTYLVIHPQMV